MRDRDFIHIDQLSKNFGQVRAVDRIDIDIARGEFFALLGPSGCGKTTLLRMLGGFELPSSGEIFIDGEPMASVPAHQRPINTVFQNYAIFPHLNVFQNIAFGLRKEKLSKPNLERRIGEALEMVRLDGYQERSAHELSGGQRQRIALARALVKKPKVLLLDEPLGALDKKLREQMQIELRQLQRAVGITFVFVTHDQEEALAMADRIAIMSMGKVLEAGPPAELYAHPKTRFVAEFLGAMNFFSAQVINRENESLVIEVEGLGTNRVKFGDMIFAPGDRVTVGLRPENIELSLSVDKVNVHSAIGRITNATYLGDRSHLHVEIAGLANPVLAARQNNASYSSDTFQHGNTIKISWTQSALLLFKDP